MYNISQMPINVESSYQVLVPNINYFSDKILNQDYFSFTKLSIEWWLMIKKSLTTMKIPTNQLRPLLLDNNFLTKLAHEIVYTWEHGQCGDRLWAADVSIVKRVLKMSIDKRPNNFFVGITDRAFPATDQYPSPKGDKWIASVINIIETMLPYGEIPINALVLRTWAVNGAIDQFISKIKHKKIVLVGPSHLENLGYKLNLENYSYMPIHDTEALLRAPVTKNNILTQHTKLLKHNKDVIYFIVGGSAAMWLTAELHEKLDRAYIIDIGRALDVYYYYDPIKHQLPQWMWGGWLDRRNPTWVKKNFKKDLNGIYCINI